MKREDGLTPATHTNKKTMMTTSRNKRQNVVFIVS